MSVSGSSGVSVVTGDVTTVIEIPTSNPLTATGTGAKQTVYTVPVGKIFRLYCIQCGNSSAGECRTYHPDDTALLSFLNYPANGSQAFCSAIPLAVYEAGDVLSAYITNGHRGYFFGSLEDI